MGTGRGEGSVRLTTDPSRNAGAMGVLSPSYPQVMVTVTAPVLSV